MSTGFLQVFHKWSVCCFNVIKRDMCIAGRYIRSEREAALYYTGDMVWYCCSSIHAHRFWFQRWVKYWARILKCRNTWGLTRVNIAVILGELRAKEFDGNSCWVGAKLVHGMLCIVHNRELSICLTDGFCNHQTSNLASSPRRLSGPLL